MASCAARKNTKARTRRAPVDNVTRQFVLATTVVSDFVVDATVFLSAAGLTCFDATLFDAAVAGLFVDAACATAGFSPDEAIAA